MLILAMHGAASCPNAFVIVIVARLLATPNLYLQAGSQAYIQLLPAVWHH